MVNFDEKTTTNYIYETMDQTIFKKQWIRKKRKYKLAIIIKGTDIYFIKFLRLIYLK